MHSDLLDRLQFRFVGLTLGSVFPFTVTLLGINDVPFGITSVNITFDASMFPLFVKVVVYVIISFTLANCLSADFVVAIEALLIVVCTSVRSNHLHHSRFGWIIRILECCA